MPRQLLTSLATLAFALISVWPAQAAEATPAAAPVSYHLYIPAVVRNASSLNTTLQPSAPSLAEFVANVQNGSAASVRGVYVADHLALPVVAQPDGNAGFVSTEAEVVTQFGLAANYGVTGLLAHNYLAGQKFFELEAGDKVTVVYGDGHTKAYRVAKVLRFQALQPDSATSSFVDLSNGQTRSATDVFVQAYTGGDQVTFQTCIAADGQSSWGRLFVIATPIN